MSLMCSKSRWKSFPATNQARLHKDLTRRARRRQRDTSLTSRLPLWRGPCSWSCNAVDDGVPLIKDNGMAKSIGYAEGCGGKSRSQFAIDNQTLEVPTPSIGRPRSVPAGRSRLLRLSWRVPRDSRKQSKATRQPSPRRERWESLRSVNSIRIRRPLQSRFPVLR